MKTRSSQGHRLLLKVMYGHAHYIDWISELEAALAKQPKVLHMELIGLVKPGDDGNFEMVQLYR